MEVISKRINSNKFRLLLVENELRKLQKIDADYLRGKNHFEEDGTKNYLVFQPVYKYFKTINSIGNISGWKSKGLSNESIKTISTSNDYVNPLLNYAGTKILISTNIVDMVLDLIKKGEFSIGSNGFGRNVIIFGADMNSSVHANNKAKNTLVLGKDFVQGLDNTTIYAAKMYSISFTENIKKLCLSLHCNGANSYLFVSGTEIYKFKAKDPEIVTTSLCLGNISKEFSVDNMKKTVLNGYVYDFSVNYGAIAIDDILDIHKYLMIKNGI